MAFVRDKDAHTRGPGAIAALDHAPQRQARARAKAKLLARRDRRMVQALSGGEAGGFATMNDRMRYGVTSHPPRPIPTHSPYMPSTVVRYPALVGHPPKKTPIYRRSDLLLQMMGLGAIPVAPTMGRGRRPILDPGGVIEGEGKSDPISISVPGTPVPGTGGSGGGSGGIRIVTGMVAQALPGAREPKRPIKHPNPPQQPPAPPAPAPVVLLPVPNVTVPYPGSSGGGGGGGGGSSSGGGGGEASTDLVDEVVEVAPPPVATGMSTGTKIAIGIGVAGLAYYLYEQSKKKG